MSLTCWLPSILPTKNSRQTKQTLGDVQNFIIMRRIDYICSPTRNGPRPRIFLSEALAIGAVMRSFAEIIKHDPTMKENFRRAYGDVALDGLEELLKDIPN